MKRSLVGLLLILASLISYGQAKLIQRGPFNATRSMSSIYGKDNRLFATSVGGIYYTDDRQIWKRSLIASSYDGELIKDRDGKLYYNVSTFLYESVDNGETWTTPSFYLLDDVTGVPNYNIRENIHFRISKDTLFLAGNGGLAYTVNGQFQGVSLNRFAGKNIQNIEVDRNHIVAVELTGKIHVSLDRGVNWTTRDLPFDVYGAMKLTLSGNNLWVFSFGGLWYSDDWGENWTNRSVGITANVAGLAWSNGTLYAVANGIYFFSEEDDKWILTRDADAEGDEFVTLAVDGDNIFAGVLSNEMSPGHLIESSSGGDSWDEIPFSGFVGEVIANLAIDDDDNIYATSFLSTYKKAKNASVFERFLPHATGSMLLDGDDLYISRGEYQHNGIVSKYDKNSGVKVSDIEVDNEYSITAIIKEGDDLFVNVANRKIVRIRSSGDVEDFGAGVVDNNDYVVSLTSSSGTLYALSNGKLVKTGSDAANWQEVDAGATANTLMCVYTHGSTVVLSCATDFNTGINNSRISHDNGATWSRMKVLNYMMQIVYKDGVYYGAGYNNTFASYDDGNTWQSKPMGMFLPISILPTQDSVYVGTQGNSIFSYKNLKLQSIDFPQIADKTMGDAPFTLQATTSENLPVAFTTASWLSEQISISGNTVTLLAPGRVFVTASQGGNSTVDEATPVDVGFCINPAKPTISASEITETSVKLKSSADDLANQWFLNGEPIPDFQSPSYTATQEGVYTVLAFRDDCKSVKSEEFTFPIPAEPVTGLEESIDVQIRVYPNPATSEIAVQLPSESRIQLIDMLGVSIENRTSNATGTEVFNVRSLSKGVYLFRINTNGKVVTKRFLKQ